MANSRIATSSMLQGFPKSKSMLAGNTAYLTGDYDSIQTINLSGGETTLTFSSIPQTYKHLQLRGFTKGGGSLIRFNSDSGSNYNRRFVYGNGSSALAGESISQTGSSIIDNITQQANTFNPSIVDIYDYTSTNKFKNMLSVTGYDDGSSSNCEIFYFSGLWRSTSAITSITLSSGTFAQYSTFSLYGIKG